MSKAKIMKYTHFLISIPLTRDVFIGFLKFWLLFNQKRIAYFWRMIKARVLVWSPIVLCLLISGCKKTQVQRVNTIECLPADWPKEATDLSTYIDSFEIIPLETNENNIIGLVGQIAKFGEYIVVLDKQSQRISAFDSQGNFSHTIGNKGNGPGEYVNPSGFTITPDNRQLVVHVMQKKSLLHYSLEGIFLAEHKLPIKGHKIAFINDTIIGIHTGRMGYNGPSETYFELWITSLDGHILDSLFYYKEALSMDFGANFVPSFENGSVLYTKISDYSIFKVYTDKIDTLYKFDFGAANLDTAFYLKSENFDKIRSLSNKIQGFSTVTNTQSDLLASFSIKGKSQLMLLVNNYTGHQQYIPLDSTGMGYYEGIPVPIPRWADDTHRYSQIPAYLWEAILNELSGKQKEICRKTIPGFQKSEEATEKDNPIILRFKFKDF